MEATMLSELIVSIPQGNPKHPLSLYRLINTVTDRVKVARQKFDSTQVPVRTTGTELLRWIILNFNLKEAESYSSDSLMFLDFIESSRTQTRNAFDPVYTKSIKGGRFVKCQGVQEIPEIILNSTCSTTGLPFDKPWDEWKKVRAFRMLFHDSSELAIDCIPGYVTFAKKAPTFVVFSLDVRVLLMKWYKYNQFTKNPDVMQFIKLEYSGLYEDMVTTWFINLVTNVIVHPEMESQQIVDEQYVPAYVTNEALISQGVESLKGILDLLSTRAVRFQDVLDTELHPSWISIRKFLIKMQNEVRVPTTRDYVWMNILRFLPLVRIMSSVFSRDVDNPLYGQVMRRLYSWYYKNIKLANVPTMQWSSQIKGYIQSVSNELEKVFSAQIQTDKWEPNQVDADASTEI